MDNVKISRTIPTVVLSHLPNLFARRIECANPVRSRLLVQEFKQGDNNMTKMYRVYSIIERAKQDDYWLNIGVAFPHDDGDGFNVILQALPLHGNGKIVLRAYDPEKHDADETEVQAKTKKVAKVKQPT